jgi:hypothetical protein
MRRIKYGTVSNDFLLHYSLLWRDDLKDLDLAFTIDVRLVNIICTETVVVLFV